MDLQGGVPRGPDGRSSRLARSYRISTLASTVMVTPADVWHIRHICGSYLLHLRRRCGDGVARWPCRLGHAAQATRERTDLRREGVHALPGAEQRYDTPWRQACHAYAHMHTQCTLLTTDDKAMHACTCSFCCRGAAYTCRGRATCSSWVAHGCLPIQGPRHWRGFERQAHVLHRGQPR